MAKPIVLLFVSAALIFAPSALHAVGGILYGIASAIAAVDGIVPFPH